MCVCLCVRRTLSATCLLLRVADEEIPEEFDTQPSNRMKPEKLGLVFNSFNTVTGEKFNHWPKVARVDSGGLAGAFPEIRCVYLPRGCHVYMYPLCLPRAVPTRTRARLTCSVLCHTGWLTLAG